jgi:hypothetical protein
MFLWKTFTSLERVLYMFAHSNFPNLQNLLSNLQSLQTQANQDQ